MHLLERGVLMKPLFCIFIDTLILLPYNEYLDNSIEMSGGYNMLKLPKSISNPLGFTLVELLIVITIIGILAGVVTLNVTSTIPTSRDGRRIADIKALEGASEQYFSDNKDYVRGNTCYNDTDPYCKENSQSNYGVPFLNTLLTSGYIKSDTKDPLNDGTYANWYGTPYAPNPPDEYILFARLERKTSGENIYQLYNTSGAAVSPAVYYYAVFSDYNYWYNNFRDNSSATSCTHAGEWAHILVGTAGCLHKTW